MGEGLPMRMTKKRFAQLAIVRAVAWLLGIGAFLAAIINYDSLPATLPLSRWHDAPKTWFLALRIQVINLCMLGIAEVMIRALLRAPGNSRLWIASMVLLGTAGIKCVVAAFESSALPSRSHVFPILTAMIVVFGLSGSAWLAKSDLAGGKWRRLRMTALETLAVSLLICFIVVLNLPLVLR